MIAKLLQLEPLFKQELETGYTPHRPNKSDQDNPQYEDPEHSIHSGRSNGGFCLASLWRNRLPCPRIDRLADNGAVFERRIRGQADFTILNFFPAIQSPSSSALHILPS